ncbi:hypothetical protein P3T20_004721 [Paraburkholderia sp. GAS206C]|jgi:hypothetical protein
MTALLPADYRFVIYRANVTPDCLLPAGKLSVVNFGQPSPVGRSESIAAGPLRPQTVQASEGENDGDGGRRPVRQELLNLAALHFTIEKPHR